MVTIFFCLKKYHFFGIVKIQTYLCKRMKRNWFQQFLFLKTLYAHKVRNLNCIKIMDTIKFFTTYIHGRYMVVEIYYTDGSTKTYNLYLIEIL